MKNRNVQTVFWTVTKHVFTRENYLHVHLPVSCAGRELRPAILSITSPIVYSLCLIKNEEWSLISVLTITEPNDENLSITKRQRLA